MSTGALVNRKKFRHRWSHRLWIHRFAVRCYNALMRRVPFRVKYGVGKLLRRREYPYRLLDENSRVVQIGAPVDTLLAGRSRAMYFGLLTAPAGKAVIVEPDQASEHQFGRLAAQRGMTNIVFCPVGAWNEKKQLKLYVDPAHPATNFVEGTAQYEADRLRQFEQFEVPVDTVDNILASRGIENVDLISITTNGAEKQILQGMRRAMQSNVKYICLAGTGDDYVEMMDEYGYELLAHDDRGFTFQKKAERLAA